MSGVGPNQKAALDLLQLIKEENKEGKERIPNSDYNFKTWMSHLSRNESELRKLLNSLKDAHHIFVINLVIADPGMKISGTDGYVAAEPGIISDLRRYAENKLEKIYESTYYQKKSPFQITRELFPKVKELNNTPIGRCMNEVMMLEEYGKMLHNVSSEYSDSYKSERLQEIYANEDDITSPSTSRDAIDSRDPSKNKFKFPVDNNPDSSWNKINRTFTVPFLVRIHFQKYEFGVVKRLIQQGRIYRENDLKFIRDFVQEMESQTEQDAILKRHLDDMVDLRRYSQARLNMLKRGFF